jgi:hypothetical protein
MNELENFLHQTASVLTVQASITEFGVSRTLRVELNQRIVEITTNGPMLWLFADFDWPGFPTDGTFITWAPEKSVLRAKLLEGPGAPGTTGDFHFDTTYLIHGPSAEQLSDLHPEVIRTLLVHEPLRPHLTGQGLSHKYVFYKRKHIRCEPSLFSGSDHPGIVKLGTERFKPDYVARWAEELSILVISLAGAAKAA